MKNNIKTAQFNQNKNVSPSLWNFAQLIETQGCYKENNPDNFLAPILLCRPRPVDVTKNQQECFLGLS